MDGDELAAARDPVVADHAAAVLGEGHPAFGLAPVGLDHRRDRADAAECRVEHAVVDALAARLGAQLREPALERIFGGRSRPGWPRQGAGQHAERPAPIGQTHDPGSLPISMSAIA